MFNSNAGTLPVSIPLGIGNCGGGLGNGFDDIIALAIIAMIFGWNGNGGIFGGGNGGANANYVLSSDFATIQRQLSDGFGGVEKGIDTLRSGLCDGFYTEAQLFANTNMNVAQGFNATQGAIKDCCCQTQSGIERINTQNAMNTATITGAIKDCCCENEMIAMQNKYEAAQANCATLQAIDKLGDRILGYMSEKDYADVKAENQTLKSQAFMQNLVRPTINPCYLAQNPYCSCGNANPLMYGYGYGTTIA